jgi:tartrate-resistant acid phosphatase type 5
MALLKKIMNRIRFSIFLWFLTAWVLAACLPTPTVLANTPTGVIPTLQSPSPSASIVPAPSPAPSETFTSTQAPSETFTPIPIPSETYTSTPLPAFTETSTPNGIVRFAVIGDFGTVGQGEQDVANLVKSWEPDFVITVGDNNYPLGSAKTIDQNVGQYYHQYIDPYIGKYGPGADINRFFPSLGNHDWYTPGAKPYLDYFTLPGNERYYGFAWGPLAMFAIDSDANEPDGFRQDSIQANWLKGQLASSNAPWKIVYFHEPPYSSGTHGSSVYMRWPFEEWGVSAVLSGHDHSYERLQIGNIPYIVDGLGGDSRYDFKTPLDGSMVRYNSDFGAMLVKASLQTIIFQFITRAGEDIDTYTMNK